jgi:DNA-binding NtrC family response regulator
MRMGLLIIFQNHLILNRLLNTVHNALDKTFIVENKILKKKVSKITRVIGESEAIDHIKVMIDKVAPQSRVLITGPNW